MKIFDRDEIKYFDSLYSEKLRPIRDRYDAECNKIDWSPNQSGKLTLHIGARKQFEKEAAAARVQAFIEACQFTGKYPTDSDYKEFADDLYNLARRSSEHISRIYNDPLSSVRAETEEKVLERYDSELGQILGLALIPLQRFVSEGKLLSKGERFYKRAKSLYQETRPLDQNTAKLIIELSDDAVKEFGNTKQEKKVELREMKEKAEEVLPPKTVEELKKRAEGKALNKFYPRHRILRIALSGVIVLVIVAFFYFTLRQTITDPSGSIKVKSSPNIVASPHPSATPTVMPTPALSPKELEFEQLLYEADEHVEKPFEKWLKRAPESFAKCEEGSQIATHALAVAEKIEAFDTNELGMYRATKAMAQHEYLAMLYSWAAAIEDKCKEMLPQSDQRVTPLARRVLTEYDKVSSMRRELFARDSKESNLPRLRDVAQKIENITTWYAGRAACILFLRGEHNFRDAYRLAQLAHDLFPEEPDPWMDKVRSMRKDAGSK